MSDTPLTDDAQLGTGRVTVDFARRLKRQRNGLLEVMERIVVGYEKHVSISPSDLASAKAAIAAVKNH